MATPQAELDVRIRGRDELSVPLKRIESDIIRFVGSVSAALAAINIIAFPVRAAAEFQREMLNVQKTTGFTSAEIARLGTALTNLSLKTNISAVEMAQIAAAAGQMGLGSQGSDAILQFTETTARMASVLDISAEEAGRAVAKLSNIFKIPLKNAETIASGLNEVSNRTTASGAELINVLQRLGDAAGSLDFSEALALSATGVDFGLTLETIGTSFTKVFQNMQVRSKQFAQRMGKDTNTWSREVREDGIGALKEYVQWLTTLNDRQRNIAIVELSGGGRIGSLMNKLVQDAIFSQKTGRAQVLDKALTASQEGVTLGVSAIKEEQNVLSGFIAQLQILRNHFGALAGEIGERALPALTGFAQEMAAFLGNAATKEFFHNMVTILGQLGAALAETIRWVLALNVNWAALAKALQIGLFLKIITALLAWGRSMTIVQGALAGVAALTARSASGLGLFKNGLTGVAGLTQRVADGVRGISTAERARIVTTNQAAQASQRAATIQAAAAGAAQRATQLQTVAAQQLARVNQLAATGANPAQLAAARLAAETAARNAQAAVRDKLRLEGEAEKAAQRSTQAAQRASQAEAAAAETTSGRRRKAALAAAEVENLTRQQQLINNRLVLRQAEEATAKQIHSDTLRRQTIDRNNLRVRQSHIETQVIARQQAALTQAQQQGMSQANLASLQAMQQRQLQLLRGHHAQQLAAHVQHSAQVVAVTRQQYLAAQQATAKVRQEIVALSATLAAANIQAAAAGAAAVVGFAARAKMAFTLLASVMSKLFSGFFFIILAGMLLEMTGLLKPVTEWLYRLGDALGFVSLQQQRVRRETRLANELLQQQLETAERLREQHLEQVQKFGIPTAAASLTEFAEAGSDPEKYEEGVEKLLVSLVGTQQAAESLDDTLENLPAARAQNLREEERLQDKIQQTEAAIAEQQRRLRRPPVGGGLEAAPGGTAPTAQPGWWDSRQIQKLNQDLAAYQTSLEKVREAGKSLTEEVEADRRRLQAALFDNLRDLEEALGQILTPELVAIVQTELKGLAEAKAEFTRLTTIQNTKGQSPELLKELGFDADSLKKARDSAYAEIEDFTRQLADRVEVLGRDSPEGQVLQWLIKRTDPVTFSALLSIIEGRLIRFGNDAEAAFTGLALPAAFVRLQKDDIDMGLDKQRGLISARFALIRAQTDKELKLEQEQLRQREISLEFFRRFGIVTLENYYKARLDITEKGLAAELTAIKEQLAEAQELLAIEQKQPDNEPGILRARARITELDGELKRLQERLANTPAEINQQHIAAQEGLTDQFLSVERQFREMTGTLTWQDRLRFMGAEWRDFLAQIAGDAEKVKLVEQLINRKAAQEEFDKVSQDIDTVFQRLTLQEQRLASARKRGVLTATEAWNATVQANHAIAAGLQKNIELLKEWLRRHDDPAARLQLAQYEQKLQDIANLTDDLAADFNTQVRQSLGQLVESLVDGSAQSTINEELQQLYQRELERAEQGIANDAELARLRQELEASRVSRWENALQGFGQELKVQVSRVVFDDILDRFAQGILGGDRGLGGLVSKLLGRKKGDNKSDPLWVTVTNQPALPGLPEPAANVLGALRGGATLTPADLAGVAQTEIEQVLGVPITPLVQPVKQVVTELGEVLQLGVRELHTTVNEQAVPGFFTQLGDTLASGFSQVWQWVQSVFGGGFGKTATTVLGAVFHRGGVVGQPATVRAITPWAFAGAPRYHSGGMAGLRTGEVAAILQRGEEVLRRDDPRHQANQTLGGRRSPTPIALDFRIAPEAINMTLRDFLERELARIAATR